MTVLDERSDAAAPVAPPSRARVSSIARWRLAARLARRDVRRRPGRTTLVTLLVAIPVMGMVLGSVIGRTQADTWSEQFGRVAGDADLMVEIWSGGTGELPSVPDPSAAPVIGRSDEEWSALLPAGSTFERTGRTYGAVRRGVEARHVQFLDLDLRAPLVAGVIDVVEGRAPSGAGELALDRATAEVLGASVGEPLTLDAPQGTWVVSGLVRRSDSFRDPLVVFGSFDWERVGDRYRGEQLFIDLPAGTTRAVTVALMSDLGAFGEVRSREIPPTWVEGPADEVSAEAMAWGWVVGALALCVVGIVIASAFATSARRQLVTLGQLSANGADRALLRRTLALQGSWTGLVGSVLGIAVAGLVLLVLRDLAEFVVSRRLGRYEVAMGDLVVIALTGVVAATVAALVPARSTARVPVMAALAGRRPLGAVPRRLVPTGVALFGGGILLLVLATTGTNADSSLPAVAAVLGGLGVLFGMCATSPSAVAGLGAVGSRLGGSWRLAARSLVRTRTRAAAVVTGTAATAALAIAGTMLVTSAVADVRPVEEVPWLPDDTVVLAGSEYVLDATASTSTVDDLRPRPVPVPSALVAGVAEVMGGSSVTVTTRRSAVWDPAPIPMDRYGQASDGTPLLVGGSLTVADPVVLDLLGLSALDRQHLDDTGILLLDEQWAMLVAADAGDVTGVESSGSSDGAGPGASFEMALDIEGRGEVPVAVAVAVDPLVSRGGIWPGVITEVAARDLGLEIVDEATVLRAPSDLTRRQLLAIQELERGVDPTVSVGAQVFDLPADGVGSDVGYAVQLPWSPADDTVSGTIRLAILGAALLLTLFVVGVGLSLSNAESRDELAVLTAMGASPATLRQVAARKALLLAFTGTLLALPTGLLPTVAVLAALPEQNSPPPIVVPWGAIALIVFVVPLVAGAATLLASAVGQRFRPVRAATLHAD
jgi:putative ABC transport system permease protein